jgi:hypothetical protein
LKNIVLYSTGKYNGNIAEVTWKTATDNVLRQYNYQYDALNRLKKGSCIKVSDTSFLKLKFLNFNKE